MAHTPLVALETLACPDKASISIYDLNADIEKSSISKQLDIEENAFDIEDSSIPGGSQIPDIGYFSFLGASISIITVFYIGIYSSISKINIVADIEAQHLSFDIENS
jgi:hypothetical protein